MTEPPARPKVYIYPACHDEYPWRGEVEHDYLMVALDERGDWYLSHVCSDPGWARHDLHDRGYDLSVVYEARFGGYGDGEFYDLVQVDNVDEIPLVTLVAAGIRNPDGSRPARPTADAESTV